MGTSRIPVFQERFKELRGDITQGQFAEKLGISRPTVSLYESGARIPDAEVLRTISEKCGVSADYLLGLTEVQTAEPDFRTACQYTGLSEEAVFCLNKLPDLGKAFSKIICEYGLPISHALNLLEDAVTDAQEMHEKLKQEIKINPDNPDLFAVSFQILQPLVENIELALYRFERECRRVPDEIYETSFLLDELNAFVFGMVEGDNG